MGKDYRILNLDGAWFDFGKKDDAEKKCIFNTNEERSYTNNNGEIITIKPDKAKLYSATMSLSLETERAFAEYPLEVSEKNGQKYTDLFVNFKFEKNVIEDEELKHKDGSLKLDEDENPQIREKNIQKAELRERIYTRTVMIDDIEYCFFKRGAAKARTANVIFCKKKCYDTLFDKCLLGLKFKKGDIFDITSMQAYISLIMSSIVDTIEIKAENILIINDLQSPKTKYLQTNTVQNEDGSLSQNEEEFETSNNMTDGQALADESLFVGNKTLEKATCCLLRNDFLKANACRTRLQEYYKENNITKVYDKFRKWIDADKILLVLTPSALKYLKFKNQFESEEKCFEDWLEKVPSTYGIVKTDHAGNYGYSNRLAYQHINSLNLSFSNMQTLLQPELEYHKLLRDNSLETNESLDKAGKKRKADDRKKRNEMSYILSILKEKELSEDFENGEDVDIVEVEEIETVEENLKTKDMIAGLINQNSDFRFTKKFKEWKQKYLENYVANLRMGKIRIRNSLYAIMISCPYEFLVATTRENNVIDTCIMTGWECYCPRFKIGSELLGIRNPQINQGNIASFTNKYHEEYKWFGCHEDGKAQHDFVVFINSYNTDVMNRLQGCDWDIDSVFLTDNKLLVSKAKESMYWKTPCKQIEGQSNPRPYTNETLAEIDSYLAGSTMAIGKIVNKSAVFNAYMYNNINTKYNEDYVLNCYKASSLLSSCSQIAIDMAKKDFSKLSLSKEMNKLNSTTFKNSEGIHEQILQYQLDRDTIDNISLEMYIKDLISIEKGKEAKYELIEVINDIDSLKQEYENRDRKAKLDDKFKQKVKVYQVKMIVPYFFKYISSDNDFKIPTRMECGMDYLQTILDNLYTKAREVDKVDIKKLLLQQKELDGNAYNKDDVDKSRCIINKCQSILDKNQFDMADSKADKTQKNNFRKYAKQDAISKLEELNLNEKTVYRILLRALDVDKNYKGHVLYNNDDSGNPYTYENKKTGKKCDSTVRELKKMAMLTLTLIYSSYPEGFLKSFIENKIDSTSMKRYWI